MVKRRYIVSIFKWLIALLVAFVILFPMYWIFISSITPPGELFKSPIDYLPDHPTLDSYKFLIQNVGLLEKIGNTLIIVGSSIILSTIICVLAAYAFARFANKIIRRSFGFIVITMLIPEIVMAMCKHFDDGVTEDSLKSELLGYQQKAMRTLGFACQILEGDESVIKDGKLVADDLRFMGITAIADPVRGDVPAAIQESLDAGLQIKIVTGDTPGTATEIGRQIGLWNDEVDNDSNRISGPDFAALPDDEAAKAAKRIKIMSRARPTDKSRLVSLLQQQGEVVAVTGDGTNDAPALNAAQVGLSMGDGTSVAKEASDITIMDNSFASITRAVMWGRSLYQNIQRFILFQLTVNLVACIIVLIGAFTGQESPLSVTQMLWVNLIMDTFAALSLASLPPNKEVMKDKPRHINDFIINRPMKWFIIGVSVVFVFVLFGFMQYLKYTDLPLSEFSISEFFASYFRFDVQHASMTAYDLTVFFTFFVFLQFWNLFNAKSFESGHSCFAKIKDSKVFFMTVLLILAGQIIIVNFGGMMFNVTPLKFVDWVILFVTSSFVMWLGEIVHFIYRKRNKVH